MIQKRPFIFDPYHKNGYNTALFYGGNLDFANYRSYLTRESVNSIVDIQNFPNSLKKQKWGVPDELIYDNGAETFIRNSGKESDSWKKYGKAFLQVVTTEFLSI